ncbi:hypothetical protein DITRI_Ditri06bG0094700 [Diplodiscus trichospermus]
MSLFQMPVEVKSQLDKIVRSFFWGDSLERKRIHWVHWSIVCNSLEHGGLGFVDLKLKNRVLMNKWIWRYGMEEDALWSKVTNSKYGGANTDLLPNVCNYRRFSTLWKNITNALIFDNEYANTFSSSVGYSLGNSGKIKFWDMEWILGTILKFSFPRIFALAVNKEGRVKEYGNFVNNVWGWNITLRRRLFGWKMQ